jgi:hypothetical protein
VYYRMDIYGDCDSIVILRGIIDRLRSHYADRLKMRDDAPLADVSGCRDVRHGRYDVVHEMIQSIFLREVPPEIR